MINNILLAFLALVVLVVLVVLVGCDDSIDSSNDYVSIESHNQGIACLTCHSVGGSEKLLTSGATVYTTIDGSSSDEYANNYTIRLVLGDTEGTQIDYTSGYGTGNSNTITTLSYFTFTAKVIDSNGTVVNSSDLYSHNQTNFLNCNSCHTSTGTSGAPGRIVSYEY